MDSINATKHFLACCTGAEQLLEKLIRGGADVNKTASGGVTPLHVAAERGNTAAVQCLLNVRFPSCVDFYRYSCLLSPHHSVGNHLYYLPELHRELCASESLAMSTGRSRS